MNQVHAVLFVDIESRNTSQVCGGITCVGEIWMRMIIKAWYMRRVGGISSLGEIEDNRV